MWHSPLQRCWEPQPAGTAISEAVELATTTPHCKYTLGSVMSHVTLHQTIIGLEAEKQMEMAGEYPDIVIACFGGGSNFGGLAFPFMRHNILDGKTTAGEEFGAVESVKAASDLISPISGTVVEINEVLEDEPEQINKDAFANWIMKVKLSDASELEGLMSASQYEEICK